MRTTSTTSVTGEHAAHLILANPLPTRASCTWVCCARSRAGARTAANPWLARCPHPPTPPSLDGLELVGNECQPIPPPTIVYGPVEADPYPYNPAIECAYPCRRIHDKLTYMRNMRARCLRRFPGCDLCDESLKRCKEWCVGQGWAWLDGRARAVHGTPGCGVPPRLPPPPPDGHPSALTHSRPAASPPSSCSTASATSGARVTTSSTASAARASAWSGAAACVCTSAIEALQCASGSKLNGDLQVVLFFARNPSPLRDLMLSTHPPSVPYPCLPCPAKHVKEPGVRCSQGRGGAGHQTGRGSSRARGKAQWRQERERRCRLCRLPAQLSPVLTALAPFFSCFFSA